METRVALNFRRNPKKQTYIKTLSLKEHVDAEFGTEKIQEKLLEDFGPSHIQFLIR